MLPIFHTDIRELSQMQTVWAQAIDPVISQADNNGLILENIVLKTGDNVINHKLGRKLQGWQITRMQDTFVQLFDKQNTNQMQDKTLILNSSGIGKVNIKVF
jgi:hypothetical protein